MSAIVSSAQELIFQAFGWRTRNLRRTVERMLADDGRGRVACTPQFIDADTAARWFAALRDGVAWRTERRMMYDREVEVPRLLGHYRLDSALSPAPAAIGTRKWPR